MKFTILLVLSLFLFGCTRQDTSSAPTIPTEPIQTQNPVEEKKLLTTPVKAEHYVSFSPQVFANTSDSRRVLFFYANWCPTCIPADKEFSENTSAIPNDVTVIRVNYNDTETDEDEKELAKKYGITYQHTFVQIDANGEVVTKWNGGRIEELNERVK